MQPGACNRDQKRALSTPPALAPAPAPLAFPGPVDLPRRARMHLGPSKGPLGVADGVFLKAGALTFSHRTAVPARPFRASVIGWCAWPEPLPPSI